MNKSEFLQIQHPNQWAKELRSFTNKMMVVNAFLVELRERNEDIYNIPESDISYKTEANDDLLKFISTQIDSLVYNSLEINNMNYDLTSVTDFIENLEITEQ